jgi:hypothetical protein
MEEYGLSPDELIAKDFRIIQSSRRGYHPFDKRSWIEAIKKIHNRGGSLSAGELGDTPANLYKQGVWLFGDWNKALSAAGFDPEQVRMRSVRDREKIILALRGLKKRNLPLYAKYVMKNHTKVFSGALAVFPSWNEALRAAGITNKAVLRRTRLGLLRQLHEAVESGKNPSQALSSEIAHYFGSLRKARIALKTDAKLLSGWSKRKIVAALTQMHRSKQSLGYSTGRHEFPALVSAAEAYFGSWGKALNAAGIDPNLYFVHHTWRKPRTGLRRV